MLSEEYVLNTWKQGDSICPYCGNENVEFESWSSYDAHCEIWWCKDCDKDFEVWLQVCDVVKEYED